MSRNFRKYAKYTIGPIILIVILNSPFRHAAWYNYVAVDDVFAEALIDDVATNLTRCSYKRVLDDNKEIEISQIYADYTYEEPAAGGEYVPKHCVAGIKTAVIVPYRDRKQQLRVFLNYMHSFLQNQTLHYRIFLVEQNDALPFNRGKMLNVGAMEAIKNKYPCLILHDIDLMPLNTGNLYGCWRKPRHMCSSLDIFRYNLPYVTLFGGVVSITASTFRLINGLSNKFDGWGGEDDDLYLRLLQYGAFPYRFAPELSKYTMLRHKRAVPSKDRFEKLENTFERQLYDGLSTLEDNYVVKLKELYTHILVT